MTESKENTKTFKSIFINDVPNPDYYAKQAPNLLLDQTNKNCIVLVHLAVVGVRLK